MQRLPNFVVIGAMKSATSTLYEQLLRQTGIFLPRLKEPNFFSDDHQYARGLDWYGGLFKEAQPTDIVGEASTHYTKLPTYPETITRMRACLDDPKLIYIMRDPLDRLVSQYIHQWSVGEISCGLDEALTRHSELIAYSCYSQQLAPFIEVFGKRAILPVFFDRFTSAPQEELIRICRFIGFTGTVQWDTQVSRRNISAERVRRFPLYDVLVEHPLAATLRRNLVPKSVRTKIRGLLSRKTRPSLKQSAREKLTEIFDSDLETLGGWLGVTLDCRNFRTVTAAKALDWKCGASDR